MSATSNESDPDVELMSQGLRFDVVYIGCISILRSMKETMFDDRSAVTKECILRVAESARCITVKDRKVPSYVKDCVKTTTDLKYGGHSVELIISTARWIVKLIDSDETIFAHDMRNVSFASAGDGVTADFVAYVAKNDENDRRCYVFDCPSGLAQEIITTMGCAFRLRYEQVTKSPPQILMVNADHRRPVRSPLSLTRTIQQEHNLPSINVNSSSITNNSRLDESDHSTTLHSSTPTNFDLLQQELWFHGPLSREMSERLVSENGQFLVRQSENQPEQFVLTGMQDSIHRHLLLIDEEGNVRTKDKKFNDICDLIQYHRGNNVPISSTESFLILRTPVNRHVA